MLFERLLMAASHSTPPPPGGYSLFGFGSNGSYQMGNGGTTDLITVTQIGAVTTWIKLFAANTGYNGVGSGSSTACQSFSFGIQNDNSLWTWGSNVGAGTGLGLTTGFTTTPTKIGTATWSTVAASDAGFTYNYALGIQTNGTLWGWGENASYYPLGLPGISYTTPTQVGSATNWTQIATMGNRYSNSSAVSIGIQSNGTIWSTGTSATGALGQGATTSLTSFTQIGSGTTWAQVACGCAGGTSTADTSYTLAVQTNGTLWGWGDNSAYQLGNGTTTPSTTPVQIGVGITRKYVYANGQGASFGIQTNGTLWACSWAKTSRFRYNIWLYSYTYSSWKRNKLDPDTAGSGNNGVGFTLGLQSNGTLWASDRIITTIRARVAVCRC